MKTIKAAILIMTILSLSGCWYSMPSVGDIRKLDKQVSECDLQREQIIKAVNVHQKLIYSNNQSIQALYKMLVNCGCDKKTIVSN